MNQATPNDPRSALIQAANQRFVYTEFRDIPTFSKSTGVLITGAGGDVDRMNMGGVGFEYEIKGTQTILLPALDAGGLNFGMDQTDNDGVEVTNGILARSKAAFVVGTDGDFYGSITFSIEDVSGTDDCAFGFRKAEAYQANIDDYNDMAVLNVISGEIWAETIVGNAATISTDLTKAWADGETHTLTIRVNGSTGAVRYYVDDAACAAAIAYSFTAGLTVVPFFFMLNASDVVGKVLLQKWEAGFQGPGNGAPR